MTSSVDSRFLSQASSPRSTAGQPWSCTKLTSEVTRGPRFSFMVRLNSLLLLPRQHIRLKSHAHSRSRSGKDRIVRI